MSDKLILALVALALLACGPAAAAGPTTSLMANPAALEEDSRPAMELENDPDMYLQLIGRLQDKDLYFASLAHLDAFDRRWPGNPRAALLRGHGLREAGYPDQAGALYQGLLAGPLAAEAQHGLGLLASRKGDHAGALEALTLANRLNPTSAAVLNDLGYVQILLGRLAEAGFNLHKAAELDPKNARAGANLALYYLLGDKPARAEGIMDWYRLSNRQRKEINEKANDLKGRIPP
jgi:Flp pilus assembly protein TadD